MKSILHLKFIALYIIFGFLCIFTTATLTEELLTDRLEEDTSRTLYREATLIANDYLPSYFTDGSPIWAVQSQLAAMRLYLESSLWFVKDDGTMITSSNVEGTSSPEIIEDFNPAEIGGNQFIVGTYHDYFDEDVITVMAPVTQGFSTEGYLLIHKPVSSLDEICSSLLVPVYISLFVIFLLSFIFLLGFHFFVYRPLRQITEAAKQYAMGNLEYEIPCPRTMRWGICRRRSTLWLYSSKTWMIIRKRSWRMYLMTSVLPSLPSKGMWRRCTTGLSPGAP